MKTTKDDRPRGRGFKKSGGVPCRISSLLRKCDEHVHAMRENLPCPDWSCRIL